MIDVRDVGAADVYKGDVKAGTLEREEHAVVFRYDAAYVAARGEPVGFHLSLDGGEVRAFGGSVPPFFAGLLPEGARLGALVARVKTSADDMLSLLVAVGADTVGDVRVVASGSDLANVRPLVEVSSWDQADFEELFALSVSTDSRRAEMHAIPGVQEKVSAAVISFPVTAPGASQILKLTPPHFPHLVENESFFMRMAAACGVDAARTHLVHDRSGRAGLLVERFDRAVQPDGSLLRLHQEDGCQLCDAFPADKYRLRLPRIAEQVQRFATARPLALRDLVRLVAFSVLIGNEDLHAKNVSVHRNAHGVTTLTPAYDLLTTLPYRLRHEMALDVEGRGNKIRRSHILAFAERIGAPQRAVERSLDEMIERSVPWLDRLHEIGFDDLVTSRLRAQIATRREDLARR